MRCLMLLGEKLKQKQKRRRKNCRYYNIDNRIVGCGYYGFCVIKDMPVRYDDKCDDHDFCSRGRCGGEGKE